MQKIRKRFAPILWLLATSGISMAQSPPTLSSLNPPSTIAGGAGLTITATGTNFVANTVGQVNGVAAPTVIASPTRMQLSIPAAEIATPGTLLITAFTPVVGVPGGGFTSNPLRLLVTVGGTAPTLTSVSPGFAAPGSSSVQLTLIGTNFRPGAAVVISPPLPSANVSTGTSAATDVQLQSVSVLSSSLISAQITISNQAMPGLRAVDVINVDGTSTAGAPGLPGTSQPLRIPAGTALGAPLSVTTIAVLTPKDGSVFSAGNRALGEARMATTGSGVVQGAWYWDGRIVEQFALNVAGGQSIAVRTNNSFPTDQLGPHTVELRILEPNQLSTRSIHVVVNPTEFSVERLKAPENDALQPDNEPPQLEWAPVPGISRYQVGFSTEPYISTIQQWYDVTANHWSVPPSVWESLPNGALYWTERAVEMTGDPHEPLSPRRLWRIPLGALRPTRDQFVLTPQGNPLLEWNGLDGWRLYRITICADPEGMQDVRRYLTDKPKLDLRALRGKLDPTRRYYWRVELLDGEGHIVLTGPQNPIDFNVPQSLNLFRDKPRLVRAAYVERPLAAIAESQAAQATSANEVKSIATHAPAEDATVGDPKTPIAIVFSKAPNVFDLALLVDGTDVTSLADVADTRLTYTPAVPLTADSHEVKVTLGDEMSTWKFKVKLVSAAEAERQAEVTARRASRKFETDTQIATNTEWVSGAPPEVNTTSVAEQLSFQDTQHKVQINGSGLLNSLLAPETLRTSHGYFDNYVVNAGVKNGAWGLDMSFGAVAPSFYQNAQLVTTAAPRQGLELSLASPAGVLAGYANTDDVGAGGGFGYGFHQQIYGAGWDAPFPKKKVELRLMWLAARDQNPASQQQTDLFDQTSYFQDSVAVPSKGTLYGALMRVHLGTKWLWDSEYGWGYNDAVTTTGLLHQSGRGWRTALNGVAGPLSMAVGYLDISPHFGSPADPNLSPNSTSDRRGPNGSFVFTTPAGSIALADSFLQSNVHDADLPEQEMNSATATWSKNLDKITALSISGHDVLTFTGYVPPAVQTLSPDEQLSLKADQRDSGINLNLSRQLSKTTSLNLSGTRDWFRNHLFQESNAITTSALAGSNWIPKPYFQLNGNVSFNWVAGAPTTAGTTRNMSAYLQPAVKWLRAGLQVLPLASVNQSQTTLENGSRTSDLLSQQYGGRIGWVLPRRMRFTVLTMDGEYNDVKDPVGAFHSQGITLYLLATFSWDFKHPAR